MKRLVVAAAIAALSAGVFAAEGDDAPKAGDAAQAPAAEAPAHRGRGPGGVHMDRAKFEERIKKRNEERRAKVADILKAAGLAEDKVAGTVAEIEKVYVRRPPQRPVRPGGPGVKPRRPPRQRPQAEAAPAPAPAQQ